MPQKLVDEANELIAKHRNKAVDLESDLWGQPVERYTRMVSKDPQARLALISSHSEELANKYDLSYAAGLWRESLFADLLWYVDGTPSSRPSDYCAPSWSWASVTGAITCVQSSELIGTCYVMIKEVHTTSSIKTSVPVRSLGVTYESMDASSRYPDQLSSTFADTTLLVASTLTIQTTSPKRGTFVCQCRDSSRRTAPGFVAWCYIRWYTIGVLSIVGKVYSAAYRAIRCMCWVRKYVERQTAHSSATRRIWRWVSTAIPKRLR